VELQTKVAELGAIKSPLHDLKRRLLLRKEQHPLTCGERIGDDIVDCLALACARRPLDDEIMSAPKLTWHQPSLREADRVQTLADMPPSTELTEPRHRPVPVAEHSCCAFVGIAGSASIGANRVSDEVIAPKARTGT
jgi:hypothetical protein